MLNHIFLLAQNILPQENNPILSLFNVDICKPAVENLILKYFKGNKKFRSNCDQHATIIPSAQYEAPVTSNISNIFNSFLQYEQDCSLTNDPVF